MPKLTFIRTKKLIREDYENLRLQIENKSQNLKNIKGTGPENLKNPIFLP